MGLELERRAQKRKAITEFTVPDMPKLPHWFIRKFDLKEYEEDMELFRQRLQTNIREALLSVRVGE